MFGKCGDVDMMVLLPIKHYLTNEENKYDSDLTFEFVDIEEKWKELIFKGKPSGYKISNLGHVKKPDGTPSPLYYDKDGYTRFCLYIPKNHPLYKNKKRIAYPYKTHRAVAELFIKNNNKKVNVIVMHKNDIPDCNVYLNLQWGSPKDNMDDKLYSGRSKYSRGKEKVETIFTENEVNRICELVYNKNTTCSNDIIEILGHSDEAEKYLKSYKILISNIKKGHCWNYIRQKYINQ